MRLHIQKTIAKPTQTLKIAQHPPFRTAANKKPINPIITSKMHIKSSQS